MIVHPSGLTRKPQDPKKTESFYFCPALKRLGAAQLMAAMKRLSKCVKWVLLCHTQKKTWLYFLIISGNKFRIARSCWFFIKHVEKLYSFIQLVESVRRINLDQSGVTQTVELSHAHCKITLLSHFGCFFKGQDSYFKSELSFSC